MAFSKVTLNGTTLMDVTQDTVSSSTVLSGEYATGPDGVRFQGTYVPGGGGSTDSPDDIIFIDYDGTIISQYTKTDFLGLSQMPANPSHAGLSAQGWNWSLSDAKSYVEECDRLVIGQCYVTDDDTTRFYCSIENEDLLALSFTIGIKGTVIINWGDNSSTDTLTGTNTSTFKTINHTYNNLGNYTISVAKSTSETEYMFGGQQGWNYTFRSVDKKSSYDSRKFLLIVKKIEFASKVSLANYSVSNYQNLETITVPNDLKITTHAFDYCFKLKSFVIPNNQNLTSNLGSSFTCCTNLIYVSISKNLTELGANIFASCFNLKRISIPDSITKISDYAFEKCYSLTLVTIPKNVVNIGQRIFNDIKPKIRILSSNINYVNSYSFYMQPELDEINLSQCSYCGTYAFYNTSITSAFLSSSLQTIPTYMFANCAALTSISIPSSVISLGNSAMLGCKSLLSIYIPSSVSYLGNNALKECSKIKEVNIDASITTLSSYTFSMDYELEKVTLPSTITEIGSNVFEYCYALASISIPSNITLLGQYAFSYCSSLESIHIPNTLSSIGNYAFSNSGLRNIIIDNDVTSLGNSVFYNCSLLTQMSVPSTVNYIGNNAFYGCGGVDNFYFYSTTPPTLGGTGVFSNTSATLKIHVPYSSDHSILSAYQTATNWAAQSTKMVEMDP